MLALMKDKRRRYLRFALRRHNAKSGVRDGVFSCAYALRRDLETDSAALARLEPALDWLNENLPVPHRFSTSRSKGARDRNNKGISWLKPEATTHIAMMHELASVLGECGHVVDVLSSTRPGYIVYEDAYQVVAEPFADIGA